MNSATIKSQPRKVAIRKISGSLVDPSSWILPPSSTPHAPSPHRAAPRSERPRCGGRTSKFMAVAGRRSFSRLAMGDFLRLMVLIVLAGSGGLTTTGRADWIRDFSLGGSYNDNISNSQRGADVRSDWSSAATARVGKFTQSAIRTFSRKTRFSAGWAFRPRGLAVSPAIGD